MNIPEEITMMGGEDQSPEEHARIQEWRRANWHKGYILTLYTGQGRPLIHRADCWHFGSAGADNPDNLATHHKACATSRGSLSKYARTELGQMAKACTTCLG